MKHLIIVLTVTGFVIAAGCGGGKQEQKKVQETTPAAPAAPAADYLTPTLQTGFPPYESITDTAILRITEDEWRQIEFISKDQRNEIDSEIVKIQEIYTKHSTTDGVYTHFSKIAMRDMHINPLSTGFEKLKLIFGSKDLLLKNVVIYNHPGQVKGGFSFISNGITYYGIAENDTVKSFCIFSAESIDALKAGIDPIAMFLKKEKLLLVDWRKMKALDENNLREGLLGTE